MIKMHADEVDTDSSLVRRLLAAQFPQWADLPIEPVEPRGTDDALYRLGNDMVVRLPRRERDRRDVGEGARVAAETRPVRDPGGSHSPGRGDAHRGLCLDLVRVQLARQRERHRRPARRSWPGGN